MILISRYSIADRYPTIWLTYASYFFSLRGLGKSSAVEYATVLTLICLGETWDPGWPVWTTAWGLLSPAASVAWHVLGSPPGGEVTWHHQFIQCLALGHQKAWSSHPNGWGLVVFKVEKDNGFQRYFQNFHSLLIHKWSQVGNTATIIRALWHSNDDPSLVTWYMWCMWSSASQEKATDL